MLTSRLWVFVSIQSIDKHTDMQHSVFRDFLDSRHPLAIKRINIDSPNKSRGKLMRERKNTDVRARKAALSELYEKPPEEALITDRGRTVGGLDTDPSRKVNG